MEWLSLLLPPFLDLIKAIAADSQEDERQAMIDMELGIARAKAAKKFGPRPPSGPPPGP